MGLDGNKLLIYFNTFQCTYIIKIHYQFCFYHLWIFFSLIHDDGTAVVLRMKILFFSDFRSSYNKTGTL